MDTVIPAALAASGDAEEDEDEEEEADGEGVVEQGTPEPGQK